MTNFNFVMLYMYLRYPCYVNAQLDETEVKKKRDAEIFELKKKALMLDMEIKEEQLNALRNLN
jgi:hypothetical protein